MRVRISLVSFGTANERLVMRPAAAYRAGGWAMIAFALVFGPAGFAPNDSQTPDPGAGTMMVVFAALVASIGISLITAKATVDPSEIRYRYGLVRRRIPASDIEAIGVGPCSGAFYPRACPHIHLRARARPIRLVALQRADTSKGRRALDHAAADMRDALRS
jgi:hypothetical protein